MTQIGDRYRSAGVGGALLALGLLTAGCGPPSEAAIADLLAQASPTPQRGGTLEIGTIYVTISALSWDPADWNWKLNHDAGGIYEQLFAADLAQAISRGGAYPFRAEAWLPTDAIRGELAESWEWEDPLTLVVRLRRGVLFPAKPGVMEQRDLDAQDVLFTWERQAASPKMIRGYFDHVESVEARDSHTVVFRFREFNAEWPYRFGYGFYSAIVPREIGAVDASDWRHLNGTGPFRLTGFVPGNAQTYERNSLYWDHERVHGIDHQLPYVDRIVYRVIKDEATQHTALRTGKIDILEIMSWLAVDWLKETTPELRWKRYLGGTGQFLALRVDQEPFDDLRVRRALNLAVDQQEIVDLYYGGHAELLGHPMHPEFVGYYQPLDEMPESVRELFGYDPEAAKRLLAEAGYPNGFRFTAQVNASDFDHAELMPLVAGYLERVGVEMVIEPLEYASFLSRMTTKTHGPGYLMKSGHTNPTTSLRKNFTTGQLWNPSGWSDPGFDTRMDEALRTRDEEERQRILRELTVEVLDQAPYVWLPTPYNHVAWWPWVRNYDGELRAGAVRPWPIYARIWIDHDMKRRMGFE
ncbi:MAG TPA: ABC transporter substrate-binding protein [Thermoanaerobaculia bacterium]|nr:ABC transporter substrate-binding protein [Thermoanaerobaculia bacterium]